MTTLNKKQIPDLPVSKITGLDTALSNKVPVTYEASKLYGTDESGNQITYNLDEVGGSDGETIRNQNTDLGVTTLLYNWEGTFQQYIEQDIEHLHPEWICLITDDIINGSIYTPDLLDTKWSDHLLDNPSWVLSDGEWKSKTLCPKIYEHIENDYLENSSYYYAWTSTIEIYGIETTLTVFTLSETPTTEDDVYSLYNGKMRNETTDFNTVIQSIGLDYIDIKPSASPVTQCFRDTTKDGTYDSYGSVKTETISGTTITYYQAEDGHKIILPDQLTNADTIYADTGIAWYYVLDTENERFKLPRTKFAFTGIRTAVGNYVEAGVPNITGYINKVFAETSASTNGAFKLSDNYSQNNWAAGTVSRGWKLSIDASKSNAIYGNSDTVQPAATEMYLYFYAGTYHATDNNNVVDVLEAIYPVGSLYFGTQTICPMEAIISGSTWELLPSGKAIWTGDGTNANTTINAGLPNITGSATGGDEEGIWDKGSATGAFGVVNETKYFVAHGANTGNDNTSSLTFDASKSNAIYGNSNTVQPPAYVVNVWKRTA